MKFERNLDNFEIAATKFMTSGSTDGWQGCIHILYIIIMYVCSFIHITVCVTTGSATLNGMAIYLFFMS